MLPDQAVVSNANAEIKLRVKAYRLRHSTWGGGGGGGVQIWGAFEPELGSQQTKEERRLIL